MRIKHKLVIVITLTIFACISCIIIYSIQAPIKVNNLANVEDIVTKEHGLQKLLLAEAIFEVRSGFGEVEIDRLVDDVGLKLECKRQTAPNAFYYVLCGDGYRCFIFVDDRDIVRNVLTIKKFPTTTEAKRCIQRYSNIDEHLSLANTNEYSFNQIGRICGSSPSYWHYLFLLEDGALIMKAPYMLSGEKTEYYFYTNEEWIDAQNEWDGFHILPCDKEPW